MSNKFYAVLLVLAGMVCGMLLFSLASSPASGKLTDESRATEQPAPVIAKMAGIDVPPDTTLLIAMLDEVGIQSPLSLEILAPILAFYIAEDIDQAIDRIELYLNNPDLLRQHSLAANRLFKEKYNWEILESKLAEIINSMFR